MGCVGFFCHLSKYGLFYVLELFFNFFKGIVLLDVEDLELLFITQDKNSGDRKKYDFK